jgi:hypothetical protein
MRTGVDEKYAHKDSSFCPARLEERVKTPADPGFPPLRQMPLPPFIR